jgi:hypothetical protein
MFSDELRNLLFQVIKSWQVVAVSIVLILYMSLVSYAARAHHKPSSVSKTKPKKIKKAAEKPKEAAEPAITEQD